MPGFMSFSNSQSFLTNQNQFCLLTFLFFVIILKMTVWLHENMINNIPFVAPAYDCKTVYLIFQLGWKHDKQFWVLILPNKFSVRIKHDENFWVLILTKKFSVRIKHEWKFWVLILTNNFAVSIKSFYMLESFRNNRDIYISCGRVVRDFESEAKPRCNFLFW